MGKYRVGKVVAINLCGTFDHKCVHRSTKYTQGGEIQKIGRSCGRVGSHVAGVVAEADVESGAKARIGPWGEELIREKEQTGKPLLSAKHGRVAYGIGILSTASREVRIRPKWMIDN